jgi:hypothetical protein
MKRITKTLVEVLKNKALDTAASSSNPVLSLPESHSTFLNLSNESDIYRIEESESFHNSIDDIAE